MSDIKKISQSLSKGLFEYIEGRGCGKQFQAKYLNGVEFPSTTVQDLGNYFEYICTGALPRNGVIPEPKRSKQGVLNKAYELVEQQALMFKKTCAYYGIEIIGVGVKWETDGESGILDVLCKWDSRHRDLEVVIDIKSTGFLISDDKELHVKEELKKFVWNDLTLSTNEFLMIQAVHYKYLGIKKLGYEPPFYFFVFDTSHPTSSQIYEIEVSNEKLSNHEKVIQGTRNLLEKHIAIGFEARPHVKTCYDCHIRKYCNDKVEVPSIKTIEIY